MDSSLVVLVLALINPLIIVAVVIAFLYYLSRLVVACEDISANLEIIARKPRDEGK